MGQDNITCLPCVKGCKKCSLNNQINNGSNGTVDQPKSCDVCFDSFIYNSFTTRCDIRAPYIGKFIDRNYNLANCNVECTYRS